MTASFLSSGSVILKYLNARLISLSQLSHACPVAIRSSPGLNGWDFRVLVAVITSEFVFHTYWLLLQALKEKKSQRHLSSEIQSKTNWIRQGLINGILHIHVGSKISNDVKDKLLANKKINFISGPVCITIYILKHGWQTVATLIASDLA